MHGMQEGMPYGVQKGMQKGMQEGMQERMQEGMQERMQEGMQEGMQERMQKSMQEGIQEGIQEGMHEVTQEGMQEGTQDTGTGNSVPGSHTQVAPESLEEPPHPALWQYLAAALQQCTASSLSHLCSQHNGCWCDSQHHCDSHPAYKS